MTDRIFKYVANARVSEYLDRGWTLPPVAGVVFHHDLYSAIMEWPGPEEPPDMAVTKEIAEREFAAERPNQDVDKSEARKRTPVYSGVLRYFPDAIMEVARLSRAGNDKHNPGEPLHWAREKSTDELDALSRHLIDCGKRDTDGFYHDVKVAWRALANLQKLIEREEAAAK